MADAHEGTGCVDAHGVLPAVVLPLGTLVDIWKEAKERRSQQESGVRRRSQQESGGVRAVSQWNSLPVNKGSIREEIQI